MSNETGGFLSDQVPAGNNLSGQEASQVPKIQAVMGSFPANMDNFPQTVEPDPVENNQEPSLSQWMRFMEWVSRAGLGEVLYRTGTSTLLIVLVLIVAWGLREFYRHSESFSFPGQASLVGQPAMAAAAPTATPTEIPAKLPALKFDPPALSAGLERSISLHTELPSRPRMDVITYTVQAGDTLFGIAEKFGLKPETLLWGNQILLGDNPHSLRPEQELNILPVDGTYHRWSEGDGLNGVAKFFGVTPEEIINFPGNHLSAETIGDWSRPAITPGTWLVIPGGKRSFVSWSLPPGGIPRENPAVAKGFGTGVCEAQADGVVGTGAFIWPAPNHRITGFDWSPETNHSGVDIDGDLGQPVYAADNGVIVYAGWNNWGYGNVVVINHGNGWQTLYAHLDTVSVGCGQSVFQGGVIGTIGSTGNSTGPHLHFEMMVDGVKVNPNNYLP